MNKSMRRVGLAAALAFVSSSAGAAVYPIAISPPASLALNLGAPGTEYPGDHAEGLSRLNESNAASIISNASGNAMSQMTYDDVINLLSIDYAYGSFYGFNDLAGNFTDTHIHGNGSDTAHFPSPNSNAGVTIGLLTSHVAQGPKSGRVTTAVTLSPTQEQWLFNNQLYFNVHSSTSAPGEIRGQIVIIPEPSVLALSGIAVGGMVLMRRRRA
jgi:hypothetical protein